MNMAMGMLTGIKPFIAGGTFDLERLAGKLYNVTWSDGLVTQWQVGCIARSTKVATAR